MINDDGTKRDQGDPAQAGGQAPVPAAIDQTAAEQEQAARHQRERERQERIAIIAKRRRRRRAWAYVKPVVEVAAGLATVGILAFTVVYSHYTGRQADSMDNALVAANAQASASAQQAAASSQSVAVARESMRVSNRPYVEIGQPEIGKPVADWILGKHKRREGIKVYFQNPGNTPGKRLYVNGVILPGTMSQFPHLDMAPVPVPGGFSWINGPLIPAHGSLAVQINSLGNKEIAAGMIGARKTKGEFRVDGDFEYTNVFDEYCCEPYCLMFTKGKFISCLPLPRSLVCPKVPNVCKERNELEFETYP